MTDWLDMVDFVFGLIVGKHSVHTKALCFFHKRITGQEQLLIEACLSVRDLKQMENGVRLEYVLTFICQGTFLLLLFTN